jgi:hypothetical protein
MLVKHKMGWLFGKKKMPRVPLPQGRPVDEKALHFPTAPSPEKVIAPDFVKEAVGVGKQEIPNLEPLPSPEPMEVVTPQEMLPPKPMQAPTMRYRDNEPLFIKVDAYQRVLGELDELKANMLHLADANRRLENSEFNEENHFSKLKKTLASMHDQILAIDKTLFKSQGD